MTSSKDNNCQQAENKGAVLVTGTSSGIGKSCAIALAKLGFIVYAGVRNKVDSNISEEFHSERLIPITLDITSEDHILAAKNLIEKEIPPTGLVGLINNAGVAITGPLECIKSTDIREQFDINVFGQLSLIQAFLPLLRESKGRIINIGSTSGRIPGKFLGPYCASKAAFDSFTSVLRMELLTSGVKVSLVEPGVVTTPFWRKIKNREDKLYAELQFQNQKNYELSLYNRKERLISIGNTGQSPEKVCAAVISALTSPKPKHRYIIGRDAKFKMLVWKYLPMSLMSRLQDKRSRA